MSQLDELIGRCDAALSHDFDEDECTGIAVDYYLAYSKQIGIETNATIDPRRGPIDHATIRSIRVLLVAHRERMEHELAVANAGASSASLSSTVSMSVSITLSQAFDAVDAETGLSEGQKAELQELLAKAKSAAARGDSSLFARIGSKIMEGVEKATPGLVVKMLEFLLSLSTGGL